LMVLTLETAALSRSKGSPERAGRALGHWSWERHLLLTVIGCAVLPAIKGSGCHLVPVICGPAFLTRDG
jgi:hypothetical protein